MAGPYRTLQKGKTRVWDGTILGRQVWNGRLWTSAVWAGRRLGGKHWGRVVNVYAHANVSTLALLLVALHLLINFDLGAGLPYIASVLFGAAFVSGLFGLFMTRTPTRRRRWLWFHRRLTVVFYLAIIPHIFTEGVLGIGVLALLAFGGVLWRWRPQVAEYLNRLGWPFRAAEAAPRDSGGAAERVAR